MRYLATAAAGHLDRFAIRRAAVARFDSATLVAAYTDLYQTLLVHDQ